ncbi:inositol monophosphatase family protein [Nocardia sp. NPDC046763]|uniref:inositol monophosphatase family protein n=1 Tax=Nocardia sp. NPDC046763 TaxID=3155256 RepID=UPI0033F73C78
MEESDVALAIRAAEATPGVVRDQFRDPITRFDKEDDGFATQADLAAELTIHDILRAARPGDRFLAEESGTTGDPSDRTWLIDPLCGTRNFAAGTPLVAVNIALRAAPQSASRLVEIDADNP